MIKVNIIALGKLKEKYLTAAFDEYKKRLKGYCDFEVFELEPVKLPEKPSDGEIQKALSKEADMIKSKIAKNSTVIAMCIEGKTFSSESLASKIKDSSNFGKGLTFIIGSSHGLHNEIKSMADIKMSVSPMTFPHQLFRIMLMEQIYRGFKINEGSAYHK